MGFWSWLFSGGGEKSDPSETLRPEEIRVNTLLEETIFAEPPESPRTYLNWMEQFHQLQAELDEMQPPASRMAQRALKRGAQRLLDQAAKSELPSLEPKAFKAMLMGSLSNTATGNPLDQFGKGTLASAAEANARTTLDTMVNCAVQIHEKLAHFDIESIRETQLGEATLANLFVRLLPLQERLRNAMVAHLAHVPETMQESIAFGDAIQFQILPPLKDALTLIADISDTLDDSIHEPETRQYAATLESLLEGTLWRLQEKSALLEGHNAALTISNADPSHPIGLTQHAAATSINMTRQAVLAQNTTQQLGELGADPALQDAMHGVANEYTLRFSARDQATAIIAEREIRMGPHAIADETHARLAEAHQALTVGREFPKAPHGGRMAVTEAILTDLMMYVSQFDDGADYQTLQQHTQLTRLKYWIWFGDICKAVQIQEPAQNLFRSCHARPTGNFSKCASRC